MALAAILSAQTPPATGQPHPTPAAPKVDPNEIVLTIGDHRLTAAQYELLVKTLLPLEQQAYALGVGRRAVAQKLAGLFVLADEADKQHLDQRPDIATQLGFMRENALESVLFKKMVDQAVVPDADVQAYYDSHRSDFELIVARHILIRVKGGALAAVPGKPELSDAEAQAKADSIRKRILAGEDFATLAKAESDDSASAAKGGDLPEFGHGKMAQQFEQAAYVLKPGDIGQPVRTPFGYHLIQVQSKRVKPLAEVKEDILKQLKPGIARKEVDDLVNRSKSIIDDKFFGPAPQGN